MKPGKRWLTHTPTPNCVNIASQQENGYNRFVST